ncbi:thiamine pyrophosphate-dependent enzyme, partial [uncultured Cyclobacterium sp.]|uniref:thiamine pyrophosphate-dependent dehydrogenase E1 component subunit alpha n=1 Tax=uncultured Cyclobacterium sp. TaxID=453820 RepID=UPI0030EF0949
MNTVYLPSLTKENASTLDVQSVLNDYSMVMISRHASLTVRKEVFMGKAKFGVYGDGKELAQVAMAKFFKMGDFRSGYYRDQTLLFAMEELSIQEYFAQLYAHTDIHAEPASGGRLMNAHFATRSLNEDGSWKNLMKIKNSTADISPTAAQMPKLLGLAYASKLYRENPALHGMSTFSDKGNEVAWGTIGNASTAEGMFFETFNAGGVLQVPMVISVWDDDYGISVTNDLQVTKASISAALEGFKRDNKEKGYEILVVNGWDYVGLVNAYGKANKLAREEHIPVLVHVKEMTQPQGHSTSGSHERYKSKERLAWEAGHDCVVKFKEYILENKIASVEELDQIENEAKQLVKESKDKAWKAFTASIRTELEEAVGLLTDLAKKIKESSQLIQMTGDLKRTLNPVRMDVISTVRKALLLVRDEPLEVKVRLQAWYKKQQELNEDRYSSHQYSESAFRVEAVTTEELSYPNKPELLDGREVLKACFDAILSRDPRVFVIGEDVGKIGDVNQAFAGLQAKHGS